MNYPSGIDVVWSPVNQAWLVLFVGPKGSDVLRVFSDKDELDDYLKDLSPKSNPKISREDTEALLAQGNWVLVSETEMRRLSRWAHKMGTNVRTHHGSGNRWYVSVLDPGALVGEPKPRYKKSWRRGNPETDQLVLDSMARTLFVEAWASYVEEEHPEETRGWGGQDLMDVAPETPPSIYPIAEKLYVKIEDMNEESIEAVVERLDADEDLFGHYLVMESLGHGVSWDDEPDRGEHELELPSIETDWDGEELYVSGL